MRCLKFLKTGKNAFIPRVPSRMMDANRETARKLFHLTAGAVLAFLISFGAVNVWHFVAITLVGFAASAVRRKKRVPVVEWFLRRMERDDAMATFPGKGAFFFFFGMLISVAIFPRDVAAASVMVLAIGDSVSPLIALRLRRSWGMKRPLEASAAGFMASFAGAALFLPMHEALIASFAGMAIESVDTIRGRRIEDNVTIPLAAGVAVILLRIIFPSL
jgi:dolichol kinase